MSPEHDQWRRCSTCKQPIAFGADYYVCNVSTCNRGGMKGFVFCTDTCWDAHLGIVRHRESWAVEARAPSWAEFQRSQAAPAADSRSSDATPSTASGSPAAREKRRIIPASRSGEGGARGRAGALPQDTLIVMSKLKSYVKARADMNCSDRVAGPLSEAVRRLCDEAIEQARADGRKTLLDRDFERRR